MPSYIPHILIYIQIHLEVLGDDVSNYEAKAIV